MVKARRPFLKQGGNHDHLAFLCHRAKLLGGWPRNGFGQTEIMVIFDITEIQRPKQFLQTNDLRPFPGSLPNADNGFLDVGLHVGRTGHLNKADVDFS